MRRPIRRMIAATREQWLQQLANKLRPGFAGAGAPLPEDLHISCGWPTHKALVSASSKNRTVGQCFSPLCSAKGTTEVFVSPAVSDQAEVAAILVHELCHAALIAEHPDAGHGPQFKALATAMGLCGKMTETTASPDLAQRLHALTVKMIPYPHSVLDHTVNAKKQGTRMLKLVCAECGYSVRTTQQWIDTGLPSCPCNGEEMQPPEDSEPATTQAR